LAIHLTDVWPEQVAENKNEHIKLMSCVCVQCIASVTLTHV